MININTYAVTEHAVTKGVALGVTELLKDIENFKDPNKVIELISGAVLSELCEVMDFDPQTIRFTPDLMRKLLILSQEDQTVDTEAPKQ